MDTNIATKIVEIVHSDLQHAEAIAIVPAPYHDIERDGYWERAHVVCFRRELRNGQPNKSGDGFSYATIRVHVNSEGRAACFDGHYDQSRHDALTDMCERGDIIRYTE